MAKKYILFVLLFSGVALNAQNITFADLGFKEKLLSANSSNDVAQDINGQDMLIDTNNNGEIEVAEALAVYHLRISNSNLNDLGGINNFSNLTFLNCSNNELSSLYLENMVNLEELYIYGNDIVSYGAANFNNVPNLKKFWCGEGMVQSVDVTIFPLLEDFSCINAQLTSIQIHGLPQLTILSVVNNQLTSMNVSGLPSLISFSAFENQLTTIDLTGSPELNIAHLHHNNLTSVNITNLTKLEIFDCQDNNLTALDFTGVNPFTPMHIYCGFNDFVSLDFSMVHRIDRLDVPFCPNLEYLIIKNGHPVDTNLNFSNNPNLAYICQDEGNIWQTWQLVQQYGYTNCTVNSYCSFNPGGTFYNLTGTARIDADNNGCDTSDPVFAMGGFETSGPNGLVTYSINSSGNYNIPLPAGTHTFVADAENPNYFTIDPLTFTVSFPDQASPVQQDFCLQSNGTHHDLEIVILPIGDARPGFDAQYRIIYKNKGNTVQSGSLSITYDGSVAEYIGATMQPATNVGETISWNFSNLLPFETREIDVLYNLNTPTQTPALNGGDILQYLASITSAVAEETPADNDFTFSQVVVNSHDPNDIVCLEGATVGTSMIGQYAHYIIRFENLGTASAQNIVVKNMIDTAKFDVATLVPLHASDPFITKISETNRVEFLFENINLPFDDANNDGYVAFKIKTKPSLVVGNTFSQQSEIYFDYNFPVITNNFTTTISALATTDFDRENFTVYPNPATAHINIGSKSGQIMSVRIYNVMGQLVCSREKQADNIDVSTLQAGHYLVKVQTSEGTATKKFVRL